MGRLKIKFHPLFAIYVFLCIYFGWFNQIFYYVITVTLHEYGHYLMIRHYGYEMDSMIFSLNGAGLKGNNVFKERHEIIISLAGPIVNLILIILTICFWWMLPTSYLYTYDFFIANISVMIFNLLPIYPLDGGRILSAWLVSKGIKKNRLLKANKWLCVGLGVVLIILFIISLFYAPNYNILIISGFMFMNSITYSKNTYFDKIQCLNKTNTKPLEVKTFRVKTTSKKELLRFLNPHYYSIFEVDNGENIITIEESDIIDT